jgi:hypothetical protein
MPNPFNTRGTIRVIFDTAANDSSGIANTAIGTHGSGVWLPENAIITNTAYDVITTFTSATDAATIAIQAQAANDIVSATAISTGTTWDNVTNMVAGTPVSAATAVKTTTEKEIKFLVAVEALTAGKMTVYIDYVVNVG